MTKTYVHMKEEHLSALDRKTKLKNLEFSSVKTVIFLLDWRERFSKVVSEIKVFFLGRSRYLTFNRKKYVSGKLIHQKVATPIFTHKRNYFIKTIPMQNPYFSHYVL